MANQRRAPIRNIQIVYGNKKPTTYIIHEETEIETLEDFCINYSDDPAIQMRCLVDGIYLLITELSQIKRGCIIFLTNPRGEVIDNITREIDTSPRIPLRDVSVRAYRGSSPTKSKNPWINYIVVSSLGLIAIGVMAVQYI